MIIIIIEYLVLGQCSVHVILRLWDVRLFNWWNAVVRVFSLNAASTTFQWMLGYIYRGKSKVVEPEIWKRIERLTALTNLCQYNVHLQCSKKDFTLGTSMAPPLKEGVLVTAWRKSFGISVPSTAQGTCWEIWLVLSRQILLTITCLLEGERGGTNRAGYSLPYLEPIELNVLVSYVCHPLYIW